VKSWAGALGRGAPANPLAPALAATPAALGVLLVAPHAAAAPAESAAATRAKAIRGGARM
jgi:hypothetical protein